jgi:hypothetical protein
VTDQPTSDRDVLRWAADAIEKAADEHPDYYVPQGLYDAADRLRRMADETAATEAHPAEHAWAVELYDPSADEWVPGTRYKDRSRAVRNLDHANKIGPMWKDGTPTQRRIVRTTTTHTVEQTTTNEV